MRRILLAATRLLAACAQVGPADRVGRAVAGLATVKTSYVVEYRDFGLPLEIGEPN